MNTTKENEKLIIDTIEKKIKVIESIYKKFLVPDMKFDELVKNFKKTVEFITSVNKITFPLIQNRIIYLQNEYNINQNIINEINQLIFLNNEKLNKKVALNLTEKQINFYIKCIVEFYKAIYQYIITKNNLHQNINQIVDKSNNSTKNQKITKEYVNNEILDLIGLVLYNRFEDKKNKNSIKYLFFYNGTIIQSKNSLSKIKVNYNEIINTNNNLEEYLNENNLICLILSYEWDEIYSQLFNNIKVNAIKIRKIKKNIYTSNENSFIVLEPDLMFDATELASTYINNKFNLDYYFLSKYKKSKTNQYLLIGNIVNYMLDEIISNEEVNYEELITQSYKNKILSFISLYTTNFDNKFNIESDIKKHYLTLHKFKKIIGENSVMIEPSFISPIYGLQGRLDLLVTDKYDNNKKNIIELKSSKYKSQGNILINNQIVRSQISYQYLVQVTCYNLLLDSTFPERTGTSQILYSVLEDKFLKDAVNSIEIKKEVIKSRNKIVFAERKYLLSDINFFDEIISKNNNNLTLNQYCQKFEFDKFEFETMINNIQNLDNINKLYFKEITKFVNRESYAQNLGIFSQNSNQNALKYWENNSNSGNKTKNINVINSLKIDYLNSDFENLHIVFINDISSISSSIRLGDSVIISVDSDTINNENDNYKNPKKLYNYIILKGYIKELHKNSIKVSLRNKQVEKQHFLGNEYWKIIPENTDTNSKKLYSLIYNSILSKKFNTFIGRNNTNLNIENDIYTKFNLQQYESILSRIQLDLIINAITNKDYYLVQGPPGSGKTSYFIKYLIKIIFENTKQNILITSFTNRAVDELCSALNSIGLNNEYFRIGNNTGGGELRYLQTFSKENKLDVILEEVKKCRIFVSTTSSLVTNPELFEVKKFDIAIIDEASQILESSMGVIFSNIEKFVMIGDEKQLPAISVQEKLDIDPLLNEEIGLIDFRISYFERMINLNIKNNWTQNYGMLEEQARMHKDIMQYANYLFYDDKLKLSKYQKTVIDFNIQKLKNQGKYKIIELILSKRVIFIDTSKIKYNNDNNDDKFEEVKIEDNKHNKIEVKIINEIINLFIEYFKVIDYSINNKTFGIISPFRIQNSNIKLSIDELLIQYYKENKPIEISIDTVERFQGSERDIILFSSVVYDKEQLKSIQSISQTIDNKIDRKLNVALTRAKEIFIMVGNSELLKGEVSYDKFLEYAEINKAILDVNEIIINQ